MSEQSKRTVFEWFAQILVPLVSAILAIQQKQRAITIGLIVLAVVSSLVSGVPKLLNWLKDRKQKKRERLDATAALDELKERIHKFVEFSTQNSDALYGLVFSRLCGSNDARFQALRLGPPQLFADFSRILATRTDERKPSMEVLKQAVDEFNGLVGMFSRYMVCPVYENVPEKLSPELLDNYTKQELEKEFIQFRERYDRFIESYLDFTKNLDRNYGPKAYSAVTGYFWRHIERPKPLGDKRMQLPSLTH
jgi:hypothetical protein